MKCHLIALLTCTLLLFAKEPLLAQSVDKAIDLPEMPALETFLSIADNSPFSVRPDGDGAEGSGRQWDLWGLLNIRDTPYAIVRNRESGAIYYLGETLNSLGHQLISIRAHSDPNRETAVIEINGEQHIVSYPDQLLESRISRYRGTTFSAVDNSTDDTNESPSPDE